MKQVIFQEGRKQAAYTVQRVKKSVNSPWAEDVMELYIGDASNVGTRLCSLSMPRWKEIKYRMGADFREAVKTGDVAGYRSDLARFRKLWMASPVPRRRK